MTLNEVVSCIGLYIQEGFGVLLIIYTFVALLFAVVRFWLTLGVCAL